MTSPSPSSPPRKAPAVLSDASAIRTRRVLEAAATARRDVSSFVSSLSAPKPPRAPAAAKNARRRSLVPVDDEVRARVRELEQSVREKDAALLALKKQLGRALIKARHARQERELVSAKLCRLAALLRKQQAALLAARTDCATLVDDVDACVAVVRRVMAADAETSSLRVAVEHLVSAAEMARAKVAAPVLEFANVDAAEEEDAKSVTSFASSLADDRDAQVDTLVELVQLLESRLSTADREGSAAAAAVSRARRTIQGARQEGVDRASDGGRERALDGGLHSRNGAEGAADTDARLKEAQRQLKDMTERVNALQKIAERAVKADEALAKNVQLESQLYAAKKTIQRMLQQRCAKSPRRHASSLDVPNVNWNRRASSTGGAADESALVETEDVRAQLAQRGAALNAHGASAETVRRILDWRQRASENHTLPPGAGVDAVDAVEERLVNGEGHSVVDSFGSVSAKSLPVQGFLKRHDSFLSMGGVSATGEEIMLANGRNPFASSKTPKVDGLRFLLG